MTTLGWAILWLVLGLAGAYMDKRRTDHLLALGGTEQFPIVHWLGTRWGLGISLVCTIGLFLFVLAGQDALFPLGFLTLARLIIPPLARRIG